MESFRMEAHRGYGTVCPESTLAAFAAAKDLGYRMIEVDPRFTADGVCVIHHDATVNRTGRHPDGGVIAEPLAVADLTLAQLKQLDFGCWKSPRFAGERIVTLQELLDFAREHAICLKLDNILERFTAEQTERFLAQLRASSLGSQIGLTCKTPSALAFYAEHLPECELHYDGPLDKRSLTEVHAAAAGHRLTIWTCYPGPATEWYKGERATPELCEELRSYGEVGVWLLTDICQLADAICNLKANAVETDGSLVPEDVFEI